MAETIGTAAESVVRNDLVVVHTRGGKLVKGYLRWTVASAAHGSLPPLPDVLQIRCDGEDQLSSVGLVDVKAVFIVKTQEGNVEYAEVRFFGDEPVADLWVRIQLIDGELLEGRVENGSSLVFAPGYWLRPTDSVANNTMVYVPKSSIVDFQVMGFTASRNDG